MKTLLLLFVWCAAISVYTYAQQVQEDETRTPAEAQLEQINTVVKEHEVIKKFL